jgi:Zn-dependent protease
MSEGKAFPGPHFCYGYTVMTVESVVLNGLIFYIYLVIIITFHEFGHAWMASRCGDDTARQQGRVTLHPLAHMDPLGTVILPLLVIFLTAADSKLSNFIIGWGKPVPVNAYNLRRPNLDDLLVAMAGPIMNVLLAFIALAVARLGAALGLEMLNEIGHSLAGISLYLCFFNLLPVPPLDGSYLLKHFSRMSNETFLRLSRFGFFIIIVLINIPAIRAVLGWATLSSLNLMKWILLF